jgi:hypothetical protein
MNPQTTSTRNGTLVDLLDRVLDRGVVLQADLIISLAGVPLIGVCLRAALAGMDTMLRYGLLADWDAKSRLAANQVKTGPAQQEQGSAREEQVVYKSRGACWVESGVYRTWQYGHVHVTDQRLFVYQEIFDKLLLTVPLEQIQSVCLEPAEADSRMVLSFRFQGRTVRKIRVADPKVFLNMLNDTMVRQGLTLSQDGGMVLVMPT